MFNAEPVGLAIWLSVLRARLDPVLGPSITNEKGVIEIYSYTKA
jgi:hypothetical protein